MSSNDGGESVGHKTVVEANLMSLSINVVK